MPTASTFLFGFTGADDFVDFGWAHTDADDIRSHFQVERGPSDVARRRFAFPGIAGEYSRNLGIRGRSNRWQVQMVAKAVANLITFETLMEFHHENTSVYPLVERGITYPRAYVETFRPVGPRVRMASPWAYMQTYEITWRVLP